MPGIILTQNSLKVGNAYKVASQARHAYKGYTRQDMHIKYHARRDKDFHTQKSDKY